MVFIRIKRGLDIPFGGEIPQEVLPMPKGTLKGTDLSAFSTLPLKVLVGERDAVRIGDPIVQERTDPYRTLVSLVCGRVKEIKRGLRRQPLSITVEAGEKREELTHPPINLESATQKKVLERLGELGLFGSIHERPFDLPASPSKLPRAIFIKALDKGPGALGYEIQVKGNEELFEAGLKALNIVAPDSVHIVHDEASSFGPFKKSRYAHSHSVEGPYPACLASVHIAYIAPILSAEDLTWTLDARTVCAVGKAMLEGACFTEQYVALHKDNVCTLFHGEAGECISTLIADNKNRRIICGNLLTGIEKRGDDPMPAHLSTLISIPEDHERVPLHFFRLNSKYFTSTRTFRQSKHPLFTTNQHGEERPFIDGAIYDRVMPLTVPVMPLVKAVMAKEFEKAIDLGLLEVAGEDFALPAFICPSKIDMIDIVADGLKEYSLESAPA